MRWLLVAIALVGCSSPAAPVSPSSRSSSRSSSPLGPPGSAARASEASAAPDRGLEPAPPTLRLPRNFLPATYAASLSIDPAKSGFDGSIAITGKVAERSSVIWLHGRQLKIKRAVAKRGGAEVELTATPHGDELLSFRAATPLDVGEWTLSIEYAGVYDELNTTGAFKQTVRNEPYVFTQLEALYARRVFPCFDEPDSKVP
ncbi:MAG TPA: hypothetical protein VLM79_22720, partial [Kofleriaceae bacterium]|nr:hypothetical protein [Kofleriaceae bacterium]